MVKKTRLVELRTTRRSVIRYEDGSRRIPGMADIALQHLAMDHVQMAGVVPLVNTGTIV